MTIFRNIVRFFNKFEYKYISDEKDGYSMAIDTNGRLILINNYYNPKYTTGYKFPDIMHDKIMWSDDKIILVKGFKLYNFNRNLQIIKELPFELSREKSIASSFYSVGNGLYIIGINKNGKYQKGVIDVDGNIMIPFEYESCRHITKNTFAVGNFNKTDIYEISGKTAVVKKQIEAEFSCYKKYKDKIFFEFVLHSQGSQSNMYGLYDQNFNQVIDLECDSLGCIDKGGKISLIKNGKVGFFNIYTSEVKYW